MGKTIKYHKNRIAKLNKKLMDLPPVEYPKKQLTGSRKPLAEWYKGTEEYKRRKRLKRKIKKQYEEIQKLKRSLPTLFNEGEV